MQKTTLIVMRQMNTAVIRSRIISHEWILWKYFGYSMNLFMQGNGYGKWNEPVLPEVFLQGPGGPCSQRSGQQKTREQAVSRGLEEKLPWE
ncbi:hypothetical protein [Akkermansia sp.]|uniref:hypothetical protein n=1 Tax=Akkermansia sp. TaxID=1872421 RepID=UPI0025BA2D61|nr:hypothetical protein [Akkermansia sp.]MCC8147377.1 hypothetical protein [Akkermansia sp.]